MYRIKYMYGFALNHDCFRSKVKRVQHAFKSESTGGENHWRLVYGCCYSRSDTVESSACTFVCFQCVNLLHVASCLNGFIYGWWYRYLGMIHCQLSGILTSYINHGFQLSILNHTSNGSWCIGIKGEMSGTVCVTFTWDIYIYIYELFIAFVCFVVCSLL